MSNSKRQRGARHTTLKSGSHSEETPTAILQTLQYTFTNCAIAKLILVLVSILLKLIIFVYSSL
jgi:hypothetical protein